MKHRCREVTHLVLTSQDRPLRWSERLKIRNHLLFCGPCTRFVQQMRFMRQAMRQWRDDRG